MDERMQFLAAVMRGEEGMAALCRAYEISRKTGYKWLARYKEEGGVGLTERSRAPRTHPQAVSAAVEATVLAARAAHPTWGPRKLLAWLAPQAHQTASAPVAAGAGAPVAAGAVLPVASTVGVLLRRAGLVVPRRRRQHTPRWTAPLAHADAGGPNAVWCADFKGQFRTGDGALCYPLTITDACSRFLLRCQGEPAIDGTRVQALFDATFREFGLPLTIRTDNGAPFASTGVGGLSRLSVWWLKLGITPERIAPGRPDQNGRHERMHRTLKKETAVPPFGPAATLRAQQDRFDAFRTEFNTERPHEALGQVPPATLYSPSLRPYPTRLRELEYPHADAVRQVRQNGELRWHGQLIFLSESLAGEPVGLTALADERYWQVTFGPLVLGVLDLARGRIQRPSARPLPPRPNGGNDKNERNEAHTMSGTIDKIRP